MSCKILVVSEVCEGRRWRDLVKLILFTHSAQSTVCGILIMAVYWCTAVLHPKCLSEPQGNTQAARWVKHFQLFSFEDIWNKSIRSLYIDEDSSSQHQSPQLKYIRPETAQCRVMVPWWAGPECVGPGKPLQQSPISVPIHHCCVYRPVYGPAHTARFHPVLPASG